MTRRNAAFLTGVAVSAAAGTAFGAAVTVNSQNRSVHVAIPSIVTEEPAIDETVTAPDNNPFDQTLDRSLIQLEQNNRAVASQNSSFGETGDIFSVLALGQAQYSATGVEGIVLSESTFELSFTLAEERSYTLSGSMSFPDTGSGASDTGVVLEGPGGTAVHSFTKADFNPGLNDGTQINPTFNESGTLAAGDYMLRAASGVSGGTNLTEILANFNVNFTAALDGEPPPPPPPPPPGVIPLPAAFWPGAMMLGGLGAAALRKRRLR